MLNLTTLMILAILIPMILKMIASMISMKTLNDREKISPFECGFDPKNSARLPFSMQFFLIAMIFLIFDIEIVLIFPFIPMIKIFSAPQTMIILFLFILILIAGLFHEWKQGALNWMK
uniref:NADH-ubiquinone oxidoreductase chain 3 n=1 Tax=Staphylinoidea sp. 5 KM-2017 TaxID=2219459 RepID=A0A346RIM9_9COLE|nr:NADH dehydrogenase subunit 3 [Staphylinoidea sp. 5 KM-2017]